MSPIFKVARTKPMERINFPFIEFCITPKICSTRLRIFERRLFSRAITDCEVAQFLEGALSKR